MLKSLEPLDTSKSIIATLSFTIPGGNPYNVRIYREVKLSELPMKVNLVAEELLIDEEILAIKGRALDYASQLEKSLDSILLTYFVRNEDMFHTLFGVQESGKLKEDEIKMHVSQCDFMKCRDLLSTILKKDKKLGGKQKELTRLFNDFILERNKYAHGILGFLYPDYSPIMEYMEKSNSKFAPVSKGIIQSFIDTYFFLNERLSAINRIILEMD